MCCSVPQQLLYNNILYYFLLVSQQLFFFLFTLHTSGSAVDYPPPFFLPSFLVFCWFTLYLERGRIINAVFILAPPILVYTCILIKRQVIIILQYFHTYYNYNIIMQIFSFVFLYQRFRSLYGIFYRYLILHSLKFLLINFNSNTYINRLNLLSISTIIIYTRNKQ